MRGIIKYILIKLSFLCLKWEYFDIFKIILLILVYILFYEKNCILEIYI